MCKMGKFFFVVGCVFIGDIFVALSAYAVVAGILFIVFFLVDKIFVV